MRGESQIGDMATRLREIKSSGCHGVFNVETLLALSVSYGALDSGKTKMELVKEEALNTFPFK